MTSAPEQAAGRIEIDREESARRISIDVDTLGIPPYTSSRRAICRYAYTPAYAETVDFFARTLRGLGFSVESDPVGNLVARNRPRGEPVFGIGSHCDSNRNGGKYDGTLGVAIAVEVCRLNQEHGLDLPLQVISFLEEEGSGFGQVLLGSRMMCGRTSDAELGELRAIDDGRTFLEHARDAGFSPEDWRRSAVALEDMVGWIEAHIEQGRVLEDSGERLGVVPAIAGYVHADVEITGRADHAGATPMDMRSDAALVAAEVTTELERLAVEAGGGTVGTVGELDLEPGVINVVPGRAQLSLDIRGVDDSAVSSVAEEIAAFAGAAASRRGAEAQSAERGSMSATRLDAGLVDHLTHSAGATGEPFLTLPSGAAHDTMCVAEHVPAAMVFVPCREGISHSPLEHAEPGDAALAAEVVLGAIALELQTGDSSNPNRR
jgi:hydantoinase/carbamoylase family amidase